MYKLSLRQKKNLGDHYPNSWQLSGAEDCSHICCAHHLWISFLYCCWNSREMLQKSHAPEQREKKKGLRRGRAAGPIMEKDWDPKKSTWFCETELKPKPRATPASAKPYEAENYPLEQSPCVAIDISGAKAMKMRMRFLMIHLWSFFTCHSSLHKLEITKIDCSFYFAYYHYYNLPP